VIADEEVITHPWLAAKLQQLARRLRYEARQLLNTAPCKDPNDTWRTEMPTAIAALDQAATVLDDAAAESTCSPGEPPDEPIP
jgi:hypothetical protein